MKQIIVEASEVWDYFQKHIDELKTETHVIAKNDEYGINVTLTEDRELPWLAVTVDDDTYAEDIAVSRTDCIQTVEELYEEYLTGKFLFMEDEQTLLDQEDEIAEREEELDDAILLFLETVLEQDIIDVLGLDADDVCEDIKDHILEYIARKHKLPIRRPMVLEDDETGDEFFEEYPYEYMVFEDEDNPIYKSTPTTAI